MQYTIDRFERRKFTVHNFPSFAEYYRASEDNSNQNQRNASIEFRENRLWLGIAGGHPGWSNYVVAGAKDEEQRINALAEKFSFKAPHSLRTRRRATRARQGDELDIHAVRSGRLDRAWRTMKKVPSKGKAKRITIIFQNHLYSAQNSNEAFYGPATAAVLCKKFDSARTAVEIITASWSKNVWEKNEKNVSGSLILHYLKNSGSPFSLAPLAVTATAGYTRSLKFKMWRNCNLPANVFMGTYDETFLDWGKEFLINKFTRPNSQVIFVPYIRNERQAMKFINETIEEYSRKGK